MIIAELVGGIVCFLTNSKPGDQKLKLNCPRDLLVCASMAISLARIQEIDTVVSATDTLCVVNKLSYLSGLTVCISPKLNSEDKG